MYTVNCKNIVLSILFRQVFSGIIKLVGGLWLTVCLFAWFTEVLRYQYEQCVGSSTLHILYYMRKGCEAGPVVYHSCPRRLEIKSRYRRISLRNQPTFAKAPVGFPAKWRLSNERRNSIDTDDVSLPRSGWHVISMEFLQFVRSSQKPVMASRNVAGCLLRL